MADIAQQMAAVEAHAQAAGVDLNIPEDQEPTTQQAAYLKLIAEAQAVENYLNDPVRLAKEKLEHALAGYPEWSATASYSPGDGVLHDGRRWVAMDDVQTGAAPDDVYNLEANTGGWKPAGE